MSILGDAIGRGRRGAATVPAPHPVPPPTPRPGPPPAAESDERSQLRRRYDALAEQVTEMHWDLGGVAYEMAIRDHFRLDVLVRRAAALQERDAELAEVERLLRMEDSASAGSCPHCAAPHSRGALFCWQCGATLMERSQSTAALAPETARVDDGGSTAVMDALLAPEGAGAPQGDPFAAE